MGMIGWFAIAGSASAQNEDATSIVMLPIVVHSADDPVFLRDGLADMLASRLEQAGGFEVIRVEDPDAMTTRLDKALENGRRSGAEFVLFGSFTKFGTGASLDMQCAAISATSDKPPLREIFVHSGSIGDVIPDLDELVGKLRRFANIRGAEAGLAASVGAAGETPAASSEIEELRARVRSLEASVLSLQEQADVAESSAEVAPDEEAVDADEVAQQP